MIGVHTQQLGNSSASCAAAPAQEVTNLLFVQSVFLCKADQCAALNPDFRFHPFRVEGH